MRKIGPRTISITMTGATALVKAIPSSGCFKRPKATNTAARTKSDFVKANMPGLYHALRKNNCGIYKQEGACRVVSVCHAETPRFCVSSNTLGGANGL